MKNRIVLKFSLSLVFIFIVINHISLAQNSSVAITKKICLAAKDKIENGAILLLDTDYKTELCSFNSRTKYIPASILKILSSMVAINGLNSEYRFKTNFWVDGQNNLIIEGLGDPYITSKDIDFIAAIIKNKGFSRFKQLLVHHSNFNEELLPGVYDNDDISPYNAINAALSVNFNTINVSLSADGSRVFSAEPETPLTEIAQDLAFKNLTEGETARINLGKDLYSVLEYASQLFIKIFERQSVFFDTQSFNVLNIIPDEANLIYKHQSLDSLLNYLPATLLYSNNMQINQIILILGSEKYNYPTNLKKARKAYLEIVDQLLPSIIKELDFSEASGLSRKNYITATAMIKVLKKFTAYYNLLPLDNGVYVKSGTLTNVYNYAGYILTKKGLRPFAIILNQTKNARVEILKLLKKIP